MRNLIQFGFLKLLEGAFRFARVWIWRTFRFLFSTCVTAMLSLWVGVPAATQNMANDWLGRAVFAGLPPKFSPAFFQVCRLWAFAGIVIGWITIAHLTVWLMGW